MVAGNVCEHMPWPLLQGLLLSDIFRLSLRCGFGSKRVPSSLCMFHTGMKSIRASTVRLGGILMLIEPSVCLQMRRATEIGISIDSARSTHTAKWLGEDVPYYRLAVQQASCRERRDTEIADTSPSRLPVFPPSRPSRLQAETLYGAWG